MHPPSETRPHAASIQKPLLQLLQPLLQLGNFKGEDNGNGNGSCTARDIPRYRSQAPAAKKAKETARTGPALPPVRFTTDSALFLSTPVAASKPSLLPLTPPTIQAPCTHYNFTSCPQTAPNIQAPTQYTFRCCPHMAPNHSSTSHALQFHMLRATKCGKVQRGSLSGSRGWTDMISSASVPLGTAPTPTFAICTR